MKTELGEYHQINREDYKGWSDLPVPKEGNIGKYQGYQNYLYELVSELKPSRILEVGFNAGHSCCCFFNAYPETKITTFDICIHGTEEPGVKALQDNGFDITLIKGDSTQSIPKFFEKYDFKYEFMFIDGGHFEEVPYKDIINTMEHLKVGGIFVVDDFNERSVRDGYNKVDWSDFEDLTEQVPPIEKSIKVLKKIR